MAKLFLSTSMTVIVLLNSVSAFLDNFDPYLFSRQINLLSPAFGPDSIAFDKINPDIAYVTISDGRVLKLHVKDGRFEDFAYTSSNRLALCDGNNDPNLAPICGKVFGLSIDKRNQIMYAVDVNLGLFSIDINQGGLATLITNTAAGLPLKLLPNVDVDPKTGDVYFIDASQTLDYRNITQLARATDSTGRLIKYNPRTKEVTVLVSGLSFPSGPALSIDGTFVLIPQVGAKNIIKYHIKGPKAKTTEVLLTLPGAPLKIMRASTLGDFWVPVIMVDAQTSITTPIAYKFNSFGRVLIKKDVSPQFPNYLIGAIQETNPFTIFVGSRFTNYLIQYSVM